MTFFADCYPKPFLSGSLTATSTLFSADEIIFPIPCDRVFTIGRDPALAANPDDSGYIDNRYNFVILVMEYAPYGSLSDLLKHPLTELDSKIVTRHVCSALQYLHLEKNMIHRDLKPQNILIFGLDPISVKLTDFGLTKVLTGETLQQLICGTPAYMAPEIIAAVQWPAEARMNYDYKVDCWALGVTIFTMLAGILPFSRHQLHIQTGYDKRELRH
ncbi:hypothetical protein EW026_g7088 [Hermanssonia centrifuga]|uniref:Protein kinase domain-containing protein n=1 Tax=Hermanssonia centrifuga TaxID=98765 RepID=A0A4V3X9I9_9APHY|nr:hypothetical protein EW026_g7088 [Hermanssonia centrifuga]